MINRLFLSAVFLPFSLAANVLTTAVTSGSADVAPGTAAFNLVAPQAAFTGSGNTTLGPCYHVAICTPGAALTISTAISSEDRGLTGSILWESSSSNYTIGPGMSAGASLEFSYLLNIPSASDPTVTLTVPFTSLGAFGSPGFHAGDTLLFNGAGTAMITLAFDVPTGAYILRSAHFDYAEIPEPTPFALTALGLAAWVLRRRRNNTQEFPATSANSQRSSRRPQPNSNNSTISNSTYNRAQDT